jgi:DNA-binding MurR/RpiR family transcriptional regulator
VQSQEPKRLDKRIQESYDILPPAERRLGDLLLNFPGDIANYSATEQAELAGTSKAAATRFFRRLGY